MPTARPLRGPRGVTLLEGLISSVVLLIGLVGVIQGVLVAALQNSMANRHTRASVIAQEMLGSLERQGRGRLLATSGLLGGASCTATPGAALAPYTGGLETIPSTLTGFSACVVDLDTVAGSDAAVRALTPGYLTTTEPGDDDDVFTRVVAAYTNATDTEITWVGVAVSWREAGRVRTVKRFTALYDTAVNQTNVEL